MLRISVFNFFFNYFCLDYFDWEDGKKLIEVPELRNDQPNRNCMCKGPACVCCVDFNITFIDLGGPGEYKNNNELLTLNGLNSLGFTSVLKIWIYISTSMNAQITAYTFTKVLQ